MCASSRTCCIAPLRSCDDDLIDAALLGLAEAASTGAARPEAVVEPNPVPLRSGGTLQAAASPPQPLPSNLEAHLDAIERDILLRALEQHRYNRTAAGPGTRPVLAPDAVSDGATADRRRGQRAPDLRTMQRLLARPEAAASCDRASWNGGWWRGARHIPSPNQGAASRRRRARRWSCCIRSACRPASTAATRSNGCSPTASTQPSTRASRRCRACRCLLIS